ncbi:MAG: glycoside hydrolase family 97 protein [Paramuribaculum sp.]|nr:glycoside hydrolase family 97 protein [Paramuribaculum sp.]
MRLIYCLLASCVVAMPAYARTYELLSPDKNITANIDIDASTLDISAACNGSMVIFPSPISLTLGDGKVIGPTKSPKVVSRTSVDTMIPSPFYRASEIRDNYNQITLNVAKGWNVVFRVYNDGIAYRFVTSDKKTTVITNETARFRFPGEATVITPYNNSSGNNPDTQWRTSFENTYTTVALSDMNRNRLSFLPLIVTVPSGTRVLMSESALESYPGMFLLADSEEPYTLNARFAPVPKRREQGGHNNLQMLTMEREDYIARVDGPRAFPWRMAVIADNDAALASSNMTYLLGEPSRLDDISWIKPGKVAWDWWNDWNIIGVPFKSGINNDTYKAYIDFASRNGIEYVILDEGWAVNRKADLMQVVPEINLPELVAYADGKGVGLILWAGYYAFDRDMEAVCKHYADMGIKGFKVDFMDHDDQLITDFNYRAAETAARHHLILDLHGTSKPAGLNRTWPNVLNFEGVYGLEQMKWATDTDMPVNDASIPFLRQVAGPLDYTQGAMRNATKKDYQPVYDDPMSQGTRAHQLALYMVFDSPLTMLCDTPSNYESEQESTDFITAIPTVWDETRVIDGKIGEYIITARRKGNEWWIGGITDWTPRDVTVDFSFIPGIGNARIDAMTDGPNAHRNGRDVTHLRTTSAAFDSPVQKIHMAPGGGFAVRVTPQ